MVSIRLGYIVDTPTEKNRHNVLKTKVSWADKHVKVIAWWKFTMRMLIEEDICLGSKPQYPERTALHKCSSQGLAAYSQKPITHSTCECVCALPMKSVFPERCGFYSEGKPTMNRGWNTACRLRTVQWWWIEFKTGIHVKANRICMCLHWATSLLTDQTPANSAD